MKLWTLIVPVFSRLLFHSRAANNNVMNRIVFIFSRRLKIKMFCIFNCAVESFFPLPRNPLIHLASGLFVSHSYTSEIAGRNYIRTNASVYSSINFHWPRSIFNSNLICSEHALQFKMLMCLKLALFSRSTDIKHSICVPRGNAISTKSL